MNKNNEIGFGIVGTGAIAGIHAAAIHQAEGAELRAVLNRSEEKGRNFAEKYSADWVSSLSDLLARTDIDVVCVTTPSGAHGEVAMPAFKAGKHVLCEKPLEVTSVKVDEMIDAAKRHGKIMAAVFQSRMSPQSQALKNAMAEGRFGNLTLCSAYVKWWRSNEYYQSADWRGTWEFDGGGALMNQGIHYVDLLQWLVGMPVNVFAFTATRAHEDLEVEDVICGSLRFPNGALGVLEMSTACFPGYKRRIEICGDRGSAVLEDNRIIRLDFTDNKPEDEEITGQDNDLDLGGGTSNPMDISCDGHRLQVEDLVRAIRENGEPEIPGREGRNAIQLIESVYQSAKSGKPVTLKELV